MKSSQNTPSVLLIDDHPAICDGAAMMLEQDGRFSSLMKTGTLDNALTLAREHHPDLIVLDFVLGGRDGADAIRALKEEVPQSKILVFSAHPQTLCGPICFRAGADGYLMKTDRLQKLPEKLWNLFTAVEHSEKSPDWPPSQEVWPDFSLLSAREMQVFARTGEGKTTSEIATELDLSEKTVFSHKENIKQKLALSNSHQLMRQAIMFSLSKGVSSGFENLPSRPS